MPTPYIKKMAKKHKISVNKSEKHWEKAKNIASKQGHGQDYALITTIYKKMIGESVSFKDYFYFDATTKK